MNVKEFIHLKEDLEQKKSALARLQGKREALLQRLVDGFDCQTIAEAGKLLAKKDKQLSVRERDYQEKLGEFKTLYGESLGQ